MRVIARTLEKLSSPVANDAAIYGNCLSACATRTFSRAAFNPMPQRQLSQWAQDLSPQAPQGASSSSSAMSCSNR